MVGCELRAGETTMEDALGKAIAVIFLGLMVAAVLFTATRTVKLVNNDYYLTQETAKRLDKFGD